MRYGCLSPRGFSLLEVLIALMIVTSGLLGILSLQNLALRQVNAAYYQNVAMAQAADLMERFRAGPAPAELAAALAAVQQEISHFLPEGRCSYQCDTLKRACTITVFWQDHGSQTLTLSSLI